MPTLSFQTCSHCSAQFHVRELDSLCRHQCPFCGTIEVVEFSLNQFQLLEVLAVGGMGTIYRALDSSLRRPVALKVLHKKLSTAPEFVEALKQEAKISASIEHPNVVRIYSFGSAAGEFYLAMELMEKGTLEDRIHRSGRLAEQPALQIALQVAAGLQAAAARGLLHRDVKPGNILFADAHTAKITDFSLAIFPAAKPGEEAETWGTPHYIAPEKLRNEPEDHRSDIYSLGVSLYHAMAGRPVFEGNDSIEIARQHLSSDAPDLLHHASHVSAETAATVHRMLSKDPDERFQTYPELIETLQENLDGSVERRTRPRQRHRHRVRRSGGDLWSAWSGSLY